MTTFREFLRYKWTNGKWRKGFFCVTCEEWKSDCEHHKKLEFDGVVFCPRDSWQCRKCFGRDLKEKKTGRPRLLFKPTKMN